MKRAQHREEQIIGVLEHAQAGSTIEELCRRCGISAATYYEWKQKFGSQEVDDAQRLRLLEEENRKLKELVADQAGWIHIPQRGKRSRLRKKA
jgi:putative transposase